MACEKWVDRYELWKEWQKNCRNPWLHKILVLLGLAKSPTFKYFKTRGHKSDYERLESTLNELISELEWTTEHKED